MPYLSVSACRLARIQELANPGVVLEPPEPAWCVGKALASTVAERTKGREHPRQRKRSQVAGRVEGLRIGDAVGIVESDDELHAQYLMTPSRDRGHEY